jgi:hypothetical protein
MKEGQPITLTVTSKETPDRMEVYEVDPDTKLVQQVITWHRPDATKENQWKITQVREYLDYNKEFDPKVFQLELPKGTVTIDRIRTIVGLEKGKLTDDEIATKVAREFFDALIAEDYERAGPLLEGMPAEQLKNSFGRMKFSRIIEIGQPVAGQHPDKSVLRVPVKVEWGLRDDKIIKQLSQKVRTTDEEKAVKVVREFYDAFNHEDVDVARRITEEAGLGDGVFDVEHFKKEREQIKSLRIVEIGKPSVDSAAGSTEVPVKVEFEVGRSVQEFKPFVRPETDGRWTICGGI